MVKMLTDLVSTIRNSQVFLLKNVSSFCKCKSHSIFFFSKNFSIYAIFNDQFKDTLTNDIDSFEKLGQGRVQKFSLNCFYDYFCQTSSFANTKVDSFARS